VRDDPSPRELGLDVARKKSMRRLVSPQCGIHVAKGQTPREYVSLLS
jgi:hypothetical protein